MTGQRLLLVLLAVATLGATAMVTLVTLARSGEQPILEGGAEKPDPQFHVPDFTLTDQFNQPYGTEQLAGKVWIVDFIFTRCTATCPRMTHGMVDLQNQLRNHPRRDDIRLVSISVDPSHDTPEVLHAYAESYGADGDMWRLLTGDRQEIWKLVGQGFRETVYDNIENTAMPIGHSSNFILIDRQQRIRGYFSGIDSGLPDGSVHPHERDLLLKKLDQVLAE